MIRAIFFQQGVFFAHHLQSRQAAMVPARPQPPQQWRYTALLTPGLQAATMPESSSTIATSCSYGGTSKSLIGWWGNASTGDGSMVSAAASAAALYCTKPCSASSYSSSSSCDATSCCKQTNVQICTSVV